MITITLNVILLTGCTNIFHEPDSDLNSIISTEDAEKSIIGAYSQLSTAFGSTGSWIQSANGDDINFYSVSEISQKENGDCYSETYFDYSILGNRSISLALYQCIHSANNLIQKLENTENKDSKKLYILGEAYFMRAYTYFRLVRIYGQVPLITEPNVEYELSISSFKEIYQLIESDLLKSVSLLPKTPAESRFPHITPHVGTAQTVLSQVYLTMAGFPLYDKSKYEKAATLASEIIDNAIKYEYSLLPDMADLWKSQSKINKEGIFVLFYISGNKYKYTLENSESGYYNIVNRSAGIVYSGYPEDNIPKAEINFFNNFPKNYRKEVTYFLNASIKGNTGKVLERIDLCTPGKANLNSLIRKFYINDKKIGIFRQFSSDVLYLFRYAHVLLNYAEAKARTGLVDDKAYECINMIRRRAHHLDINSPSIYDLKNGLTPEQFADSVVQERAWEFCAEPEGRWFDIQRLHMLDKVNIGRNISEPVSPLDTAYFLPFLLLSK